MEFSRPKYWSGFLFPSPGDLPDSGIKPGFPILQADFLPSETPGKPQIISSVKFSHSVMSHSLWPHGLQHTRPLCPSPSPKVYSSSCPVHWWCHSAFSSSHAPVSFRSQSFPASETFPMIQLSELNDQNTGVSASASVFPWSIPWFTEHGPANQNKTQFPPQLVSPIRKIP